MAKKSAAGSGSIRKRTLNKNGKRYTYWEARYSAGYDPGTGKQIQRTITGKTQKEVSQKLKAATTAIDEGTYIAPSKLTVGEWLDVWAAEYLGGVKPATVCSYKAVIKNHLKPNLGALRLDTLASHTIQNFYNSFNTDVDEDDPEAVVFSPKTVKNIHGVLHMALKQAVRNNLIRVNPCDACVLPKITKKVIQPMDEDVIARFIDALEGHRFRALYLTTIFTGMRLGEVCGLQWECVDLTKRTILIDKQLQWRRDGSRSFRLATTKNGKSRTIALPASIVSLLKDVKFKQLENRLLYGSGYTDSGFVFTDELGQHVRPQVVYRDFKIIVTQIGSPATRFHDLRHSYAVAAIKSGDDIKTVQENLGHATAAFTLDVYGHVTEKMKYDSADRMEQFIKAVGA